MTALALVQPLVLEAAQVLQAAHGVWPLLLHAADETPEPEEVKAGWTAFAIWLGMAAAVALLCWSLVRQLRKAQAAKDAGVYGPVEPRVGDDPDGSTDLTGPAGPVDADRRPESGL